MGEDLKSKLAAINAAKAERAKKAETEAKGAEIGKVQEAAIGENELRDRAKVLEGKVVEAEKGVQEAEDAIQQADAMTAEGGLEPEELQAIEGIKTEAQQKLADYKKIREEYVALKWEIDELEDKVIKFDFTKKE